MPAREVVIDFFDVGQADCSVITLSDGSLVIIDVGRQTSTLIDFLHARTSPIEAVVLTHNHFDHAGAMPALVHGFKNRVRAVFMLLDAQPDDEKFQKIFRPVAEAEKANFFRVETLDRGRVIARDPNFDVAIEAVHPSFVSTVEAKSKNEHSGVICLKVAGKAEVIWPGDLGLEDLHAVCAGATPQMLVGPHHGAPEGGNRANAGRFVREIGPLRVFISVGTKNIHSHPKPAYIKTLVAEKAKVACSQLTRHCDPQAVATGRPVFQSHAMLGLPPPRTGVSCRGAFRLTYDGTGLKEDGLDAEHFRRVQQLRRPLCMP